MLDEKELLEEVRSLRFWHSQAVENVQTAGFSFMLRVWPSFRDTIPGSCLFQKKESQLLRN